MFQRENSPFLGKNFSLTCSATTFPDMDFKKIYKSPPPNPLDQFIQDMVEEGLVGILLNKAESWEIKTAERTVTSPEENSGPKFSNATITDTKVGSKDFVENLFEAAQGNLAVTVPPMPGVGSSRWKISGSVLKAPRPFHHKGAGRALGGDAGFHEVRGLMPVRCGCDSVGV